MKRLKPIGQLGPSIRRTLPLLISLIVATTGCATGKNYERADLNSPAAWRLSEGAGESLAHLAWWDLFKDADLQALIRQALLENKELLIASSRIEEYRGRFLVGSSLLYPQIDATAGLSRRKLTEQGIIRYPSPITNDGIVSGNLNWEIDLFGRLRRLREAAQADLNAVEEARSAVVMSLVSDVATAYFQLLDYDSELKVSVRAVETRKNALGLTQALEENGVGSGVAIEQARAELETANRTAAQLKMQIAQQENAINFLLGKNGGEIIRTSSLEKQTYPVEIPAGLPSELLNRRPDIRQVEQQLIAANARTGAAQAAFFPRISLTAGFGSEAAQLSSLFGPGSSIWNLGGNLVQPIFRGGEIRGNYQATEALQKQALLRYVQTVQQAFREVNDALIAHRQLRDMRIAVDQEVKAANEGLKLANISYREGIEDFLSVLTAERQVFNSELNQAQVKRQQLQAVVQVYRALGGGWDQTLLRSEAR